MARALVAAVPVALFVACIGPESARTDSTDVPPSRSFTLLYTASLLGQLEPCGCSPDMRGGIGRAATIVERVRAEGAPVLLVDGGDRFFPHDSTAADPVAEQQRRMQAETLAEITRRLRYDALVLGERDAPHRGFLETSDVGPLLDRSDTHVRTLGDVTLGIVVIGADEEIDAILPGRVAAVRSRGAELVLGIARRTFEETKALAAAAADAGVDLLFAAHSELPLTDVSAADPWSDPPVFSLHPRGEEILRIDVVVARDHAKLRPVPGVADRQARLEAIEARIRSLQEEVTALSPGDPMRQVRTEKVLELQERKSDLAGAPPPKLPSNASAFTWAFVPVAPRLPESEPVRALLDAHDRRVNERNLALARARPRPCPEPAAGESRMVGDGACATCHPAALAFWRTTGHARAFHTLEERGKQFSAECVSCHVTGFQRPGGACDVATTEGRRDVQCEACHGPGSRHVETASAQFIVRSPSEGTCRSCHDPANSPHFNFPAYRERILGPGHGGIPERPSSERLRRSGAD